MTTAKSGARVRVNVGVKILERRLGAGVGKVPRILRDRLRLVVDLAHLALGELAGLVDPVVKDEDRIGLHVLLEFVLGAIGATRRIRHRVAPAPVGSDFKSPRPLRLSGSLYRARHRLANREDILTIHRLAIHSVALGADEHILIGGRARDHGPHSVTIVLDDEDDREFPQRGQIHGLVKRPDVYGGLSEEADADLIAAAILDRESYSGKIGRASCRE